MNEQQIYEMIDRQKQFFHTGETKDVAFRLKALRQLKNMIVQYEPKIMEALYQDLRKSEFEAYATEIGLVLDSINYVSKNLKKWAAPVKVKTPVHQLPAKSWVQSEPYGVALIIGPFNYPFQLVMEPLIGAIAAGNCAVIKPSENTPYTSALVKEMLNRTFDPSYIQVIEGEKETTSTLIHAPFDYIFFTGSVPVGKIVMEAASRHLVPLTLELGGKSPAIIDRTADLQTAAKRIVWGKFVNAGQTCVAPDYLLVHHNIQEDFLKQLKKEIIDFYGKNAQESPDYGRIVNEKQFDRLVEIMEKDRSKIFYGGECDQKDLFIAPTILHSADWTDASMQDEIFGPILPILSYQELNDVITEVNKHPKPLALYVFTENEAVEKNILSSISFGGGCVNDTLSHVGSPYLPFGGVGPSGMNSYHGKHSFDTFSHQKSVMKKSTKLSHSMIFPPYGDKVKWLKKIIK
ncbi:aldehyde dehydrogenase [Bacillus sp. FJAT-52991]|uniref:Aldehyde dehydrogenase n=1 Tax=Bacillus kandeliae TaxID=3129297 RepID=A0ABZ2NAC1_9BACI